MKHVLDLKYTSQPASNLFVHPLPSGPKNDPPFACGDVEPPNQPFDVIPPWSPSRSGAPVPKPLDLLFPKAYFDRVRAAPPSPTMMRYFNERIARLRKQGLVPEWLPEQKFSPSDMPHLLALAITQGASGCLDLADIMSDTPKLLFKLGDAAFKAGQDMKEAEGRKDVHKALLLMSATSMTGLFPLGYSPFFGLIEDPDVTDRESVTFLFSWIAEGLGEQTIRREALRATKHSGEDVNNARAAIHFLHPRLKGYIEETEAVWAKILKEVSETSALAKADEKNVTEDKPSDSLARPPSSPEANAPAPSRRTLPEAPEGVLLTSRAMREILGERRYAEDRLTDGLAILGLYRSMRIGETSVEAYRAAVRHSYFEDSPCFADAGSLKAFERYYSVVVQGRKYILDRHLKWGNGNNVISAIRIYYAWDPENQRVIVGSAPRHLPIWTRS